MGLLQQVLSTAFEPIVFLYMLLGVVAGICIGALPGLTATMGARSARPRSPATSEALCPCCACGS